jgi:hypothetical protein
MNISQTASTVHRQRFHLVHCIDWSVSSVVTHGDVVISIPNFGN